MREAPFLTSHVRGRSARVEVGGQPIRTTTVGELVDALLRCDLDRVRLSRAVVRLSTSPRGR